MMVGHGFIRHAQHEYNTTAVGGEPRRVMSSSSSIELLGPAGPGRY
jgi:hypothetical protein